MGNAAVIKMTVNKGQTVSFSDEASFVAAYKAMPLNPTDRVRVTVNGRTAAVEEYRGQVVISVF